MYKKISFAGIVAAALLVGGAIAFADSVGPINFESYTVGNINGQDGWSAFGSAGSGCALYDEGVSDNSLIPSAPASFGTKSFRISNAVTSGCFGDQAFSKPVVNAAGETSASSSDFSIGTLQRHFEAQFSIAAIAGSIGDILSVSPDRGDGARMSYLRFENMADGIHVYFDDVTDPGHVINGDSFNETQVAVLDSSVPHTVKFSMDFYDGPDNDVVKIYIDGNLVHIGTSWEDYYRFDTESNPSLNPNYVPVVRTVLFRAAGTAVPANAGKGFLIDNLTLSTGSIAPTAAATVKVVTPADLDPNANGGPVSPAVVATDGLNKWFLYNDTNDTVDNTLGTFVVGPGTPPHGVGSVQMTLGSSPYDRKNIATYQFGGMMLNTITQMSYAAYSHSGVSGPTESPFFNFNVDFTGSGAWQHRLVYVPADNGPVPQDTWNTFDVISGGNAKWVYSGAVWPTTATGPDAGVSGVPGTTARTWNDILADYPQAQVLAGDPWLGIRVGEPGPSGYTGNVDSFTIATSSAATTFDFEPASYTVTIDKFVDGRMATAATAHGSAFPMTSSWSAANIGSGSGSYTLGPTGYNSPNAYEAITSAMTSGASYTTQENTSTSLVGTSCGGGRQYALAGYTTGESYASAAAETPTMTVPDFTSLSKDEYVIVWNKTCTSHTSVRNINNATITVTTSSYASTGGNSASGSAAGNGGRGGGANNHGGAGNHAIGGNGGMGGMGGTGGVVLTGNAHSNSRSVNIANTNVTREYHTH